MSDVERYIALSELELALMSEAELEHVITTLRVHGQRPIAGGQETSYAGAWALMRARKYCPHPEGFVSTDSAKTFRRFCGLCDYQQYASIDEMADGTQKPSWSRWMPTYTQSAHEVLWHKKL
jgi:hypothetical protein